MAATCNFLSLMLTRHDQNYFVMKFCYKMKEPFCRKMNNIEYIYMLISTDGMQAFFILNLRCK
jgi:hypothetical protein